MDQMKFIGFRTLVFVDDVGTTEDIVMLPASNLVAMVSGATDKLELHFKDTNPQIAVGTAASRAVAEARSRGADDTEGTLAQNDLTASVDVSKTRDVQAQSDNLKITLSVVDEYHISVMQSIATKINLMYNEPLEAYLMIWDIPAYGGTEYSPVHTQITAFDGIQMEDAVTVTTTAG